MKRQLAISIGLTVVLSISVNAQTPTHLPDVVSAAMPTYPEMAYQARIEGEVKLRVVIAEGKPQKVEIISGQPMLAHAARANLLTWRFAKRTSADFQIIFGFKLEPGDDRTLRQSIHAKLPKEIWVTAYVFSPPIAEFEELDLSEPLKVFLLECMVDSKIVPCKKFNVVLFSSELRVRPNRFKLPNAEGFYVPKEMRGLGEFGVLIRFEGTSFSIPTIHKSFLKGKWKLSITRAPFPEVFYPRIENADCVGVIHFAWSEPERMASAICTKATAE